MIGPQLQKAVVARVKGQTSAGQRVYDRAAPSASFPYIELGDEVSVNESDQCAELFDVSLDLHVWSRSVGKVEAKQIGEAVRQALSADIAVDDYHVIEQTIESGRVITDPDGLTAHAVLTFRARLQPE